MAVMLLIDGTPEEMPEQYRHGDYPAWDFLNKHLKKED